MLKWIKMHPFLLWFFSMLLWWLYQAFHKLPSGILIVPDNRPVKLYFIALVPIWAVRFIIGQIRKRHNENVPM
jgi:hypothetical protein